MRDKTFLEILTEKITKAIEAQRETQQVEPASSSLFPDAQNQEIPLWVSQIPLRKIEFQAPKSQILGRVYPLNTPKSRPMHERPPRKKHSLTERQQLALGYFLRWKVGLREDYTYEELKRAFRSLAMKLHPDRNKGMATYYMEMKRHYESLKEVFSNAPEIKT